MVIPGGVDNSSTPPDHLYTSGVAMDTTDLVKLDDDIDRRGQSLARLILKRVSHAVKREFPDARTIRLTHDESTNRWRISRVTVHHNRAAWRGASDADVEKQFPVASALLTQDVNQYLDLNGARLYEVRKRTVDGKATEYSMHLHRRVS